MNIATHIGSSNQTTQQSRSDIIGMISRFGLNGQLQADSSLGKASLAGAAIH